MLQATNRFFYCPRRAMPSEAPGFDNFLFVHSRSHQLGIQSVSAAMRDEMPHQVAPGERQIAHEIQSLMAHALIVITQFILHRAVFIEYQHVLISGPLSQPPRHEPFGFFLKHEGPTGGQFAAERLGRDHQLQRLPADGVAAAVVEPKLDAHAAVRARPGFDPTFVVAQSRDVAHHEPRANGLLLDDAGRLQGQHEREAGSVAARHFGLVDPDFAIVDLQPAQGRHHMLDHLDADPAGAERRATRRLDPVGDGRRDARRRLDILPHEHDAGVHRRGPKFHPHVTTAPKTESRHRNSLGNRALFS